MKLQRQLSSVLLAFSCIASLLLFTWPLFFSSPLASEAALAQTSFMVLMPLLILIVLSELSAGSMSPQELAMLAMLTAVNAVVRMFGAGVAGIETAFFLIIISGYVFRSSFGFAMGSISLLVSAILTGGVGPWLPFQMMAAALVGAGAGLIPRIRNNWVVTAILIAYALIASFTYGALMTMWNWPFLAGTESSLSFLPGAGFWLNLQKFWQFQIFSGGLIWDTGRALTTSVLVALTAPALLTTLKRAANRAGGVSV